MHTCNPGLREQKGECSKSFSATKESQRQPRILRGSEREIGRDRDGETERERKTEGDGDKQKHTQRDRQEREALLC